MKKSVSDRLCMARANSSAAGTHMMSLLRAFRAETGKSNLQALRKTEHMVDLNEDGITTQVIALNCSSFDEYVQAYNPDIVMFDRFMMEEQFGWRVDKYCPNALKILDTEDLQCLRNAVTTLIKQVENSAIAIYTVILPSEKSRLFYAQTSA